MLQPETINEEDRAIKFLLDRGYRVFHPGIDYGDNVFAKDTIGLPIDRPLGAGSLQFFATLRQMWAIHLAKNAGYAGEDNPDSFANFRECEDIDVSSFKGVLVRFGDTWSRVKHHVKNPKKEQVGESITDTLIDMANYTVIALCLYEENLMSKQIDQHPVVDVAAFMRP